MMPASVLVDFNIYIYIYINCYKVLAILCIFLISATEVHILYYLLSYSTKKKQIYTSYQNQLSQTANVLETFSKTSIVVKVCTSHASCPTLISHFIYDSIHSQTVFRSKEECFIITDHLHLHQPKPIQNVGG